MDNEFSYYPTVYELLYLPTFRDSRLLAGQAGLERLVKGINLSENPSYIDWISRGEIVVTTCYAIYQDPAALSEYIPQLARKGVSAILIKPAKFLKKIPDEMISAADEQSIPLVELSESLSFGEVICTISNELTIRQTALLRSSISVNKVFVDTIIAGAELDEIARMLSEFTQSSILILDTINNRQAYHLSAEDAHLWADMPSTAVCRTMAETFHSYGLNVGNRCFGRLYIRDDHFSEALSEDMFTHILTTIPVEISREQALRGARDQNISSFLIHLASGQLENESWEWSSAESFGLDLAQQQLVIQIAVSDIPASPDLQYLSACQRTMLIYSLKAILDGRSFFSHIAKTTSGYLVFLCDRDGSGQFQRLLASLHDLLMPILSDFPALSISAGCGRPYSGGLGFAQSCREAHTALVAADSHHQTLVCFSNMGVMRLICADDPSAEADRFIGEILGCLLSDRKQNKADLLKTLESYFRNFGNIKRVSEETFTHYNTTVYRLKAIQEATGYDLHKYEDYFKLELALQLYRTSHGICDSQGKSL